MRTNAEWITSAGLQGRSTELAEMVMFVDILKSTPENIWLNGDSIISDKLVKFLLRESIESKNVVTIECDRYGDDLEYLIWDIFGAETVTPRRGASPKRGMISNCSAVSAVWLDSANFLGKPCLDYLADVISKREYKRWGGTESISLQCRWITTTRAQDTYRIPVETWMWFLKRLNPIWLDTPALHERPDDIAAITEALCLSFEKKHGHKKYFSRRSLQILYKHQWPGGHRELESTIIRTLVGSGEKQVIEPWDVRLLNSKSHAPNFFLALARLSN